MEPLLSSPVMFPTFRPPGLSCRLWIVQNGSSEGMVRVLARSPGRYPILIIETERGSSCAVYFETGYALDLSKPVSGEWVRDNAIGRHSFIEVNPPREMPASALRDYVRELLDEF